MQHDRDLVGYGASPPTVRWPNGARLAVSLVVNYEEGSERSFAMGDPDQELLTEWGGYVLPPEIRNLAMESMYEYGSRVGVWRLLALFREMRVKATFFANAVAFEQNPAVAQATVGDGHEICSHGYRWEEVFRLSEEEERQHMRMAIESFQKTCGRRPVGWYCRYGPSVNTRALVVDEGGFIYDCDAYNDDVPYFVEVDAKRHLVLPYTPDINDFSFWNAPGFVTAPEFARYLIDSFNQLYSESAVTPRMMSVGLHPRIIGRPGRISGLREFIEHASRYSDVWFATREEIARWWIKQHPQ